jgi:hypothetical protein
MPFWLCPIFGLDQIGRSGPADLTAAYKKGIQGHGSLQTFRIPTALHFRGFRKGSHLRPAPTCGEELFCYFDFSPSLGKVALLGTELFSISEKRSAMGSP